MRALFRLILSLAVSLAFASGAMAAQARPDPMILVSIDGFRADYLKRGKTPVLQALARAGVQAVMRPSFPTLTFPNHYTLVTGLRPDHHGIVDNTMDDPVLGHFTMHNSADPRWWEGGEPLWITADEHGLKTATMFWPGSDRVIRGRRPDYWRPYNQLLPADARMDQVLAWLDLPEGQRPDFITLYLDVVDTVGHLAGPDSTALNLALASTDASIGRLVAGLKARGLFGHTNLILVADHGMAAASKERRIYVDDIAGGADRIETVTTGATSGLAIAPGAPAETLGRLLAPHEHMRCWKKGDMPRSFHYGSNPRVPPVMCLADVGWTIATHRRTTVNPGEHGYDPSAPEMAALFIAEGPAFKAGPCRPSTTWTCSR